MSHDTPDDFEIELRRSLSAAADSAPRGPAPRAVLDRLAQRERRRRGVQIIAAAAALALAATGVLMLQDWGARGGDPRNGALIAQGPMVIPRSAVASPMSKAANETAPHATAARAPGAMAVDWLLADLAPADEADRNWDMSLRLRLAEAQAQALNERAIFQLALAMTDGG